MHVSFIIRNRYAITVCFTSKEMGEQNDQTALPLAGLLKIHIEGDGYNLLNLLLAIQSCFVRLFQIWFRSSSSSVSSWLTI